MAIHVEHVGVLERAREVSRLEDIITEDNEDIEAEMPKMGDDPAGKEARFLQATDEMSAALTQFMKKKIYEEQLANFLDGEEYVLEDQPIEKTDKVMEALKAATTHDYEVYSFAKKLFPDESDLVVVLRAILRKKQISENAVYEKDINPEIKINDIKRFIVNSFASVQYENISVVLSKRRDIIEQAPTYEINEPVFAYDKTMPVSILLALMSIATCWLLWKYRAILTNLIRLKNK
ncbi:hypothetical protein KER39_13230 [Escherichia coli]|nr:hypothetical protein [Escherichia coli]